MAKKLLVTVVVLMAFQDKFDHKTQYAPGTELHVDKERADDLVSRGLAQVKEEALPTKPAEEKKRKVEKAVSEKPVSGEKEKEETGAPPADNPETKQKDGSTGTEEQ